MKSIDDAIALAEVGNWSALQSFDLEKLPEGDLKKIVEFQLRDDTLVEPTEKDVERVTELYQKSFKDEQLSLAESKELLVLTLGRTKRFKDWEEQGTLDKLSEAMFMMYEEQHKDSKKRNKDL